MTTAKRTPSRIPQLACVLHLLFCGLISEAQGTETTGPRDGEFLEYLHELAPKTDAGLLRLLADRFTRAELERAPLDVLERTLRESAHFLDGRSLVANVLAARQIQDRLNGLNPRPGTWEWFTCPSATPARVQPTQRAPRPPGTTLEIEPNDDALCAQEVATPDTIQASIASAEDRDHYRLRVLTTRTLDITLRAGQTSPLVDSSLEILDPQGNTVAYRDESSGPHPQVTLLLLPGTYTFRVLGKNGNRGNYQLELSDRPAQALSPGGPRLQGTVMTPGDPRSFELIVNVPTQIEIGVHPLSPGLQSEIVVTSRTGCLLARAWQGASIPEAITSCPLLPGVYVVHVLGRDGTTGPFEIEARSTSSLPTLTCGVSPTSITTELNAHRQSGILLDTPELLLADIRATDLGGRLGTNLQLEDRTGSIIAYPSATPRRSPGTSDLTGPIVPGTLLRLLPDEQAEFTPRTWGGVQNTRAQKWSTFLEGYPGPAATQMLTGFRADHVNANGTLTIRHWREFDGQGSSLDSSTHIDELYLLIDTGQGNVRFDVTEVRYWARSELDFAEIYLNGSVRELWNDDGQYWSLNLVDSRRAARDDLAIEFDFDVSALAVPFETIQALEVHAEVYLSGNGEAGGVTTGPPSAYDEDECYNLYVMEHQILRHGANTWDSIGSLLDGEYQPPTAPAARDIVDVRITCAPPVRAILSPEEPSAGLLDRTRKLDQYTFAACNEVDSLLEVRADFPVGEIWRDHPYANRWSTTTQYVGPIDVQRSGIREALLDSSGMVRLRLRKEACFDGTIWDVVHYYDQVRLTLDDGTGSVTHSPIDLVQVGSERFGQTGLVRDSQGFVDLVANDGLYLRSLYEDYDTPRFSPEHVFADEFTFQTAYSAGTRFQALDVTIEFYSRGSSAGPVSSQADSSEELFLKGLHLEAFDHTTGAWVALAPNLIDGTQYTPPRAGCQLPLPLDPELTVFDESQGLLVGRDDDSGRGQNARLSLRSQGPLRILVHFERKRRSRATYRLLRDRLGSPFRLSRYGPSQGEPRRGTAHHPTRLERQHRHRLPLLPARTLPWCPPPRSPHRKPPPRPPGPLPRKPERCPPRQRRVRVPTDPDPQQPDLPRRRQLRPSRHPSGCLRRLAITGNRVHEWRSVRDRSLTIKSACTDTLRGFTNLRVLTNLPCPTFPSKVPRSHRTEELRAADGA